MLGDDGSILHILARFFVNHIRKYCNNTDKISIFMGFLWVLMNISILRPSEITK
jgi:hypothetical protein